jgi:hypothetical protein
MAPHIDEKSPKDQVATIHASGSVTSHQESIVNRSLKLIAMLSLVAVFYSLYHHVIFSPQTDNLALTESDRNPEVSGLDDPEQNRPYEPLKRYSLNYGKVACWQDAGVWIKELTPVEMAAVGVNRFQDTDRALEPARENEFCTRLRAYGASFWQLPPRWPERVNWCEEIDACIEPTKKISFEASYPTSGGVWVLDTSQGLNKLFPKSLGLRNALTMDERSEVIKQLGGHFCEDIRACREAAGLSGP